MKRLALLCLALLITMLRAHAFDAARARDIVNTLASDEYEGRRPGLAGGEKTEYFLAEKLREYGVYSGGQGGYYQNVPMLVTEERGAELTLLDTPLGKVTFVLGLDFTVITHSGTDGILAPAVIVGFGYVRPDKGRDDYDSVDVKDKIVVIVRGTPTSPYDFQQDYARKSTLKWAEERHAAGVIYYQDAQPVNGAAIPEDEYDSNVPLMYVGDRMLGLLLDGSGYSIETYKEKLKSSPQPIETNKRVWMNTSVRKISDGHAHNVIGFIYGTDPVLKNEIVVIGAHCDHIGKNSNGLIYPGADDNASGTGVASELARVFQEKPCKRSVMVIHFTGEEDGLLGSDYFVSHSTIPLANIVGMVNLDMEGMGTGDLAMVGGELFGPLWNEYLATLDSAQLDHVRFRAEEGHGGSDNASFLKAGIPATAFWSRGQHWNYHSYNDQAKWISTAALNGVGTQAESWVRFLGDHDGSKAFHADTCRLFARSCITLDFGGFAIDALGTVPQLSAVTAAWLPYDPKGTIGEAVRRASDFQLVCAAKKVGYGNLKEALAASRQIQPAAFPGISEAELNLRNAAEVNALIRQGLSVVRLTPGLSTATKSAPTEAVEAAKSGGMFALVPFDFATPARVDYWGSHAIVTGTLKEFAAAPATIRDGLLTSDALLSLEISETPSSAEIQSVFAGRERRVHLNFGAIPIERREEHAKIVIGAMLKAGLSREDILLLTGGNLRRFFEI